MQVLDKDFLLPIGKAKIQRPGKDVTMIAFGKMVGYNLQVSSSREPWFGCRVVKNSFWPARVVEHGVRCEAEWVQVCEECDCVLYDCAHDECLLLKLHAH